MSRRVGRAPSPGARRAANWQETASNTSMDAIEPGGR